MTDNPFAHDEPAPLETLPTPPQQASENPFAHDEPAVPASTGENYDFGPMAAKLSANLQTHAEAQPVTGLADAMEAQWQSSITGLLVRGKAPDKAVAADASFGAKLAGAATGMVGDLPANIAGFLIGAPTGAAEGAVAGPAGAGLAGAATGMAASFALPAVLRATLMDAYQKGEFQSFGDFWSRAWPIMLDTAKNWATGAVTAPAGALAGAALPTVVSPLLKAATRTAAEVATMTTVGKGLEGQLPDAQDFAVTGLLLGGVHGAKMVSTKTRSLFAKTGVTPDAVTGDAGANPTIHQDILSTNRSVPDAYATAAADPLLAALQDAVHGQESGGKPTAKTSVTGARGGMQIQPATFAEYAKPGESIDNPMDNLAVGRRIIKDLYQASGGDPEKVAVGYFSGKRNMAPEGSPTPWKHDSADPTGKTTSSYVADVMRRLNGLPATQRAARPAPEGVPEQRFIAMPSAVPEQFADTAPVYTDVFDRLISAGKPEAEADTTARLWQSHVDSVAESTGLHPDVIYHDIRPKGDVVGAPPLSPQEYAPRPAVGTTEQGGAPVEGIAGTPPRAPAEAIQRTSAGGTTESGGVPPETMAQIAAQAKVGAQPLAPVAAAKRPAEGLAGGRAPAESMAPPGNILQPHFSQADMNNLADRGFIREKANTSPIDTAAISKADKANLSSAIISEHIRIASELPNALDHVLKTTAKKISSIRNIDLKSDGSVSAFVLTKDGAIWKLRGDHNQFFGELYKILKMNGARMDENASGNADFLSRQSGIALFRVSANHLGELNAGVDTWSTPTQRQMDVIRALQMMTGEGHTSLSYFAKPGAPAPPIAGGTPPGAAAGGGGGARPPTEPPIGAPPPPGGHPPSPEDIAAASKAIGKKISVGGREPRSYGWNKFYTDFKDRYYMTKVATKALADGRDIPADQDPYRLMRNYAGVSGKVQHFLEHATVDFKTGRNNGESLKTIIKEVGRNLGEFRKYLAAKRTIELEGRGIQSGFDLNAAQTLVRAWGSKYEAQAQRVVDFQNRVAAYFRDSGVISEAEYNGMNEANKSYVPFHRVLDDTSIGGGIGKGLQPFDPIKSITGSARDIVDPLESMIKNTYKLVAIAERNRIGQAQVDLAKGRPDIVKEVPTNIFAKDQISVFYNGDRHSYQVDKALSDAFSGLNQETANTIVKLAAMPAKSLRSGATLTPDFMLRNFTRDLMAAFVNTKGMIFSPLDTIHGFMHAVRKDDVYQEWLKSGGANATMVALDRRYMQESLQKLNEQTGLMDRSWNVIRHPWQHARLASELTENATRIGEFQKAMKGRDFSDQTAVAEAAFASREVTLDFARIGARMAASNMITAFLNANIEGVDRMVREMKSRPGNFALKTGIGITLPSVLLWFANHDDERYKGLPHWQKDMFWIFLTKDSIWRMPKPFEQGVLFGSLPERILSSLWDHDPKAFEGIGQSILTALVPGILPTLSIPFEEQFANRSTFTGQPLIPAHLEGQLPEYQYNEYTTETAKLLGRVFGAFPGMHNAAVDTGNPFSGIARALTSPILLENYWRAWTGGVGMYALQASDAGLKAAGVVPDIPKATPTWADVPVIKAFAARYPSMSDQRIQDFYEEYGKRKTYHDTWQAQAKEGNVAAMHEIEKAGGQAMFVRLDSIHKAIGDINHIIRNTNKDPNMTPSDKRQLIDSMYFRAIDLAKIGNKIYDSTPLPQ